jgi:hypothetical protein
MKKILTMAIALLFLETQAKDELKYPVSDIPSALIENVNVVVREDHMKFKILARNKAIHYVHYVVTILNEKGNGHAEYNIGYDKLTKVVDINGTVYDALGKQIKKLKNKEIYDKAAFDGVSLFSDNRIKEVNLSQSGYPYTVEIEYELEYNYLLSVPSSIWGREKESYQHASYELTYPTGFQVKYKLLNLKCEPTKRTDSGFETLRWSFENLLPIKLEPFGPPSIETVPMFVALPIEFEHSGYAGKRDTWENFGKWQIELNRGRDILSEKTITDVKKLTKGLTTNEDKVRVLYEYLQSKTRYVGIQLGIGGWQPFEAKVVDEVGYGDCKALSNYMLALLKVVGVKGYYTWIYGGFNSRTLIDDITVDIFNHIVVSVPNGKDTLWLECTSQTNPFGYQGKFTGDRKALMITEEGGKIVNTIKYTADQNKQSRNAEVELDLNGNATSKIKTTYSGIQYENDGLDNVMNNIDEQKKWIQNNTEIPNFNINSFSMVEKKDKIPSAIVNLDLTLNRYATVSGKRVFVMPNLMNRITRVPEKLTERKTDVVRSLNYLDLDTIKFTIPESLYPEFLPEPIKINSKFGEYEASFKFGAGKVIYTRRMKVWKGRFPKETYNELVDFYKNVSKADNTKLVFLNKT